MPPGPARGSRPRRSWRSVVCATECPLRERASRTAAVPDGGWGDSVQLERVTNRTLRRRNRSLLLSRLFLDGPLTRQDLTLSTGLSQAAVSNVVGDLIEDGLVTEVGTVDSDGGRPRVMLQVAPRFALVVGVDVGETRVQVELF